MTTTQTRLGYLLDEVDTEKVLELADYMQITPDKFFDQCIAVMWRAYKKHD